MKKSVSWDNLNNADHNNHDNLYNIVEVTKIINNMEKKQKYYKITDKWKHITMYKKNQYQQYGINNNINNDILKIDWFGCKHKTYDSLIECDSCKKLKEKLEEHYESQKIKIFRLNNEIYNFKDINNIDHNINLVYYGLTIVNDDKSIYINVGNNISMHIYQTQKLNKSNKL